MQKINRIELQDALEKVKPGLASKNIIEQSTSFAFMGDRVVTYNDEISVSHPVKELNITGAVQAKKLYEFLNRIKKDEITLEYEGNQIQIKAGKSKVGLVFEEKIVLPIDEIGTIGKWKKIPERLKEALEFCAPCCSSDMSRPALTCLYVGEDKILATDSFQIVRYILDKKMPIQPFLLPASAVRSLSQYEITHISQGQGWVHFKTEEGTVFSSRVFEDTFPDIEKFLEMKGEEIKFPTDMIETLERAEIFSHMSLEEMPIVNIEISKNRLKVSAKDESGWFEEKAKIKYDGDTLAFAANVDFLKPLFSMVQTCIFKDNRIKFIGENWEHVIATINEKKG